MLSKKVKKLRSLFVLVYDLNKENVRFGLVLMKYHDLWSKLLVLWSYTNPKRILRAILDGKLTSKHLKTKTKLIYRATSPLHVLCPNNCLIETKDGMDIHSIWILKCLDSGMRFFKTVVWNETMIWAYIVNACKTFYFRVFERDLGGCYAITISCLLIAEVLLVH